jgi:hypothetical protein
VWDAGGILLGLAYIYSVYFGVGIILKIRKVLKQTI